MDNRLRLLFTITCCVTLISCAPKDINKVIKREEQNAQKYVNQDISQPVINAQGQDQHRSVFLKHYFSPWDSSQLPSVASLRSQLNQTFITFSLGPGYGENMQPIDPETISVIRDNANMDEISTNAYRSAITTQVSNIRQLPMSEPSFGSRSASGNAYPFDRLQDSLLAANVPVRVLHQTKDHIWSLIQCGFGIGWVENKNIASVDQTFMRTWQSKPFVTALVDRVPIYDQHQHHLGDARIGSIYPLIQEDQDRYQLVIAKCDQQYKAITQLVWVNKKQFAHWPLPPTVNQFTHQINQLLSEPYGWGGLYGYRDCSATTMDVFASFGIWLPRQAKDQATAGKLVSLAEFDRDKKLKTINEQAKGLMTLIDSPGHVMLYLGSINDTPYVFHNVWGLQTRTLGANSGRLVIGQAVITPITFGEQYWNVKASFLDKAVGMTLIE